MEGLLSNTFISTCLPEQFSTTLWEQIQEETPQQFQQTQQSIYAFITTQPSLQRSYLPLFRKNHLVLYSWYLLASRHKMEIKQYLFRAILQKSSLFSKSQKFNIKIHKHKLSMTETNQIKKKFAEYESSPRFKESVIYEPDIDSHDLYLKTFRACRGNHHSPYDFDKHMKSQLERSNYNQYIRQSNTHKKHFTSNSQPNQLQKFEQWAQIKEKISLLTVRSVLKDSKLNNQQGLHGFLRKRHTKKLVLINHQRKPINYYLRQNKRP